MGESEPIVDASDDTDFLSQPEDQYYIEEVTPENQEGYTTRADIASEEAQPCLPPTDPPLMPSRDEGADIATGFGISPEDSPLRGGPPDRDAWLQEQVQRILRADSAASKLPLTVRVENGVAFIHGFVADETDAELAESVVSQVPGVVACKTEQS